MCVIRLVYLSNSLACWPSVLCNRNLNIAHYMQTFQPNSVVLLMFRSTIDLGHSKALFFFFSFDHCWGSQGEQKAMSCLWTPFTSVGKMVDTIELYSLMLVWMILTIQFHRWMRKQTLLCSFFFFFFSNFSVSLDDIWYSVFFFFFFFNQSF